MQFRNCPAQQSRNSRFIVRRNNSYFAQGNSGIAPAQSGNRYKVNVFIYRNTFPTSFNGMILYNMSIENCTFFSIFSWQSMAEISFGGKEITYDVYIPDYHKCPECR